MAHRHDIVDDDRYFVIDPDTRAISHPSEIPLTLIQHDRNSERFTFELPRVIDGHDMTNCDKVQVHFINVDAINDNVHSSSVYEAIDLVDVEGKEDTLMFTWLISHEATRYVGPLNFAVRFMCTTTKIEADGTTSRIIDYSWNTKPFAGVVISEGMDYSDAMSGDYYDVIDTWLNTINNRGAAVMKELTSHAESLADSIADGIADSAKESINEFADEVKERLGRKTLAEMGAITQQTGNSPDIAMSQDATTKAVEEAKTLASSEVASVRSDLNAQYTDIGDSINALATHKRLIPDASGHYKLEKGKLYHICRPDGTNKLGWDMTIACHVRNWSIQTSAGGTKTIEDVTYGIADKLPEFRNRTPDIYGFQMRILDDGALRTYLENGNVQRVKGIVSYEINIGHTVHEYTETYHDELLGYTANSTHCVFGTETYTRNGLYVIQAGAVYEINENPSGTTFSVNANGISDIYKTESSGLIDTYTIVLDDGTTKTFTIQHGDTPKPKISRVPLAPGESYILQPDHRYFICGYGDNSLQVLDSFTDEVALTESPVATDIKATITSTGDGLNYGQMFKCYVKETAVLVYSGDGDASTISWKPTRIEQIFAPKTKVKNIHETGTAYVYDYGWS